MPYFWGDWTALRLSSIHKKYDCVHGWKSGPGKCITRTVFAMQAEKEYS